jgi:hypothetical protein
VLVVEESVHEDDGAVTLAVAPAGDVRVRDGFGHQHLPHALVDREGDQWLVSLGEKSSGRSSSRVMRRPRCGPSTSCSSGVVNTLFARLVEFDHCCSPLAFT